MGRKIEYWGSLLPFQNFSFGCWIRIILYYIPLLVYHKLQLGDYILSFFFHHFTRQHALVFHHDFIVWYSLCLCILLVDAFKFQIEFTKFAIIWHLWAWWWQRSPNHIVVLQIQIYMSSKQTSNTKPLCLKISALSNHHRMTLPGSLLDEQSD